MLMALPPEDLVKGIEGMAQLCKNGLRYPIPSYGIQADPSGADLPGVGAEGLTR
ncbi:hypothetical protein [Melghirimyces thermohalophilus]|uniref:hypothetical protein n=1 Tax=Melghirimyces thermohalophilus TaxID=1236220 RepID=UPI001FE111D5|nr:hypothetical protein [Melghirimyces thermohalophilus]